MLRGAEAGISEDGNQDRVEEQEQEKVDPGRSDGPGGGSDHAQNLVFASALL